MQQTQLLLALGLSVYVAVGPYDLSTLLLLTLVALLVGLCSQSLFSAVASRPYDLAVAPTTSHQMWLAVAIIAAAGVSIIAPSE